MPVLIYQSVIVLTLILTRLLAPNRLLVASWIWTGLTLVNLFFPPLIVVQLIVIWGTFALLRKFQKTPSAGAPETGDTNDRGSKSELIVQPLPARRGDHLLPPTQGPASPDDSQKTLLGGIQQGASKLANAFDVLDTYVDRQRQIQSATTDMMSGYEVERHSIEIALKSAEEGLQLKLKLDADQELKRLFEKNHSRLEALFVEKSDASTSEGSLEHKCVNFSLPSRHPDPEIAAAVERKYAETMHEYSTFLQEVVQRMQRQQGLRIVFDQKMQSSGGSQILKRINCFEAGREWRYVPNCNEEQFAPDLGATKAGPASREQAGQRHSELPKPATTSSPIVAILSLFGTQVPRRSSAPADSVNNLDGLDALIQKARIREMAVAKRIPALFHFTRTSNLKSILEHGLCSLSRAQELGIRPNVNDTLRLDGYPEAVSLSIAFPNHRMFYSYRQKEPSEQWAILAINPAIMWSNDCAFCERNAADHRIRKRPLIDLTCARAFHGMFEEIEGVASREEQRLSDFDPTDPQAEVLVFATINADQIVGVAFDSPEVLNAYSLILGQRQTSIFQRNTGPFGSRAFSRNATR